MENNQPEIFGFTLESAAQEHLKSAAKWEKFMAITQIAMMSILILAIIFGGSYFIGFIQSGREFAQTGVDSGLFSGVLVFAIIMYAIIAAVFIIPNIFRLKFANAAIKAIDNNDHLLLTQSFKHFKTHSIFWGVLTIIGIAIYVLYFVIFLFAIMVK